MLFVHVGVVGTWLCFIFLFRYKATFFRMNVVFFSLVVLSCMPFITCALKLPRQKRIRMVLWVKEWSWQWRRFSFHSIFTTFCALAIGFFFRGCIKDEMESLYHSTHAQAPFFSSIVWLLFFLLFHSLHSEIEVVLLRIGECNNENEHSLCDGAAIRFS